VLAPTATLQPAAAAADSSASAGVSVPWAFQWVDHGAPEQLAHLTGQLRWRGFDLGFAVDGLLGVDGRLTAPSLALIPSHLQQVVLTHFAHECLQTLASGSLADMTLTSVDWHEDPLPMQGEFEFTLRRPEAVGTSRGRLTVFDEAGRMQLMNALASLQWPLPAPLANVAGRLQLGTVCLTPDELAGLDLGDLVWIDDAELSPNGLRGQFQANDEEAGCTAWLKRSLMTRDALPAVVSIDNTNDNGAVSAPGAAMLTLAVKSPEIAVARSWLQCAQPVQRLRRPVLATTWEVCQGAHAVCEGRLVVVARRLGLRVTRMLHPKVPDSHSMQKRKG
jgi:hypothetical protein